MATKEELDHEGATSLLFGFCLCALCCGSLALVLFHSLSWMFLGLPIWVVAAVYLGMCAYILGGGRLE